MIKLNILSLQPNEYQSKQPLRTKILFYTNHHIYFNYITNEFITTFISHFFHFFN